MQSKALPLALLSALGLGLAASAASAAEIKCHMDFTLSGWSVIYQTADGAGTITCANGQSMPVKIDAKGGGLTVGKYKLTDGRATFSHVTDIQQILGSYATANAHAGVVHSGHAAAMTKGNVSMSLAGHGQGWDIGAGFESFSISKAK
ncbi:MAG TPA: hypothetical protein VN725_06360 [Rhodanobacteraceae bacterium]|nr:hypothetical protein [Rhodanobacteraceae bacterium]